MMKIIQNCKNAAIRIFTLGQRQFTFMIVIVQQVRRFCMILYLRKIKSIMLLKQRAILYR